MKALQQEGLKIPDDIAVTGFDGTEMSELMGLTTVDIRIMREAIWRPSFCFQNIAGSCSFDTFKDCREGSLEKDHTIENKIKIGHGRIFWYRGFFFRE